MHSVSNRNCAGAERGWPDRDADAAGGSLPTGFCQNQCAYTHTPLSSFVHHLTNISLRPALKLDHLLCLEDRTTCPLRFQLFTFP